MIHRRVGRKLKRTWSHKKSLMCNLATDLFLHKKLVTTEAKAKELRPFAESLITRARIALRNEQNGNLPTARPNKSGEVATVTKDFVQRRQVGRFIRNKAVLQELFDTIAPAVATRDGGYTRIIKLGPRRGDGGREAIIELVDFSAAQDGVIRRKKKAAPKPKAAAPVEGVAPVAAPIIQDAAPEVEEVIEETVETPVDAVEMQADTIEESPAAEEAPASEDVSADAADAGDASGE
ncbi:MAG: 50S ribosomal protein L17 [Ignavibacteria bacterium]|nr:50S ribosomal protein L17 [Ignavibacteria bacterium]